MSATKPRAPGRWCGVDYGTRRIGLAISDPDGRICSPAEVIPGTGRSTDDAKHVADWAAENDCRGIVIGLPLSMDGSDSDQTRMVRRFAADLSKIASGPVELFDERLSSFAADERLAQIPAPRRRGGGRQDAIAAQIILEAFLAGRRTGP